MGAAPGPPVPQLPERVMMALVSTPASFALPASINKGFAPPFVLRVGVVSTVPTQIKATVAAYVLQKDQVRLPCSHGVVHAGMGPRTCCRRTTACCFLHNVLCTEQEAMHAQTDLQMHPG